MKNLSLKPAIILVIIIFVYACSPGDKKINDKNFDRLKEMNSKLFAEGKISSDSITSIIQQYVLLQTDSIKTIFVDEIEKKATAPPIPKMTNDEFFKHYADKYNLIKLDKRFGQAPLYGKYADDLAGLMAEMDETNTIPISIYLD